MGIGACKENGEEGSFGSIYAKWSFGDGTKEKQVEIKLGD
jgi:hypothetical protein